LGQREARAAYEAVLSRYADQSDIAGDARNRIAALGAKPSSTLTARFIRFADPAETAQSISLDGRFHGVSYLNGDKVGDVVVHDSTSGESKTLYRGTCISRTRAGGCNGWAANTHVSPDGRQVAYGLLFEEIFELRVIPNEPGAKSRLVLRNPNVNIRPLDWTPNGQAILVLSQERGSGNQEIGLVSVQNGAFRLVRSFGRTMPVMHARVSPDGKHIAYAFQKAAGDLQIYVIAVDESAETQLTTTGWNGGPIWSPDGRHILFVSDRSGRFGLWAAAMKDGRPEGIPMSLKRDTGRITPIGMSRSGSYYYVQDASLAGGDGYNVFEAELDPITGALKSVPKFLSESFVGINS
jgi:hypothetical protein